MNIQEIQDYISVIENHIKDIGYMTDIIPKSKILKIQTILQEEVEKYEEWIEAEEMCNKIEDIIK